MSIRYFLAAVISLRDSVPFTVLLMLVVLAESAYIGLDHYVMDLTPAVGTYYNGRLDGLEEDLEDLKVICSAK